MLYLFSIMTSSPKWCMCLCVISYMQQSLKNFRFFRKCKCDHLNSFTWMPSVALRGFQAKHKFPVWRSRLLQTWPPSYYSFTLRHFPMCTFEAFPPFSTWLNKVFCDSTHISLLKTFPRACHSTIFLSCVFFNGLQHFYELGHHLFVCYPSTQPRVQYIRGTH